MATQSSRRGPDFQQLADSCILEYQRRGELYRLPAQQVWVLELRIVGRSCDALLTPVDWEQLEQASHLGFVATLRRTAEQGAAVGQPILVLFFENSEAEGATVKFLAMPASSADERDEYLTEHERADAQARFVAALPRSTCPCGCTGARPCLLH